LLGDILKDALVMDRNCRHLGWRRRRGCGALAQQAMTLQNAPAGRETDVSASASVLYDSNIARSSEEVAAARHLTLADEIFTPGVDFDIARQLGREVVFLQGNASYVFHRTDTILNRQNIDINGGLTTRILRCQELVTGTFSSAQSDLAEQSLVVVKNTLDTGIVGASADCGRATGFAPTGSVSETWRTNSAQQLQVLNSNTLATSGGLAYRQPTFGSVSLFGSYSKAAFPNNVLLENGVPHNYGYSLYAAGVTYTRRLGGRLEGSATVSYSELDPVVSGSKGFSGLTYALDGIYHANTRITVHASASRAAQPTNRIDANYSIDENYLVEATYLLGTRLALTLTGLRTTQNYNVVINLPINDLTRNTTDSLFLSATYTMNRRFSFVLNAGDEERRANVPGFNYSSTRVGFTVKATY
jgi:hypothetical protein